MPEVIGALSGLKLGARRKQMPGRVPPSRELGGPTGERLATVHLAAGRCLLRFEGLADFVLESNDNDVIGYPTPGVSDATVEHLYLNNVAPLLASRRVGLVLHGGAVDIRGSAVAFLGASGRGKSTLTASFASQGFPFLTDDTVYLHETAEGFIVTPSHPSIRLWDDARNALLADAAAGPPVDHTQKARLLSGKAVPHSDESRPLMAVFLIGDSQTDRVDVSRSFGGHLVIDLVRHSFLLDVDDPPTLASHFSRLVSLYERVPFFQIDYPRQFERLGEVREAVVAACETVRPRHDRSACSSRATCP